MKEIICPNCKEKFKADLSKKYQDCPHCHHEFSDPTLTKHQIGSNHEDSIPLMEKIKRAKKND